MAAANASLGDLRTWTHHVLLLLLPPPLLLLLPLLPMVLRHIYWPCLPISSSSHSCYLAAVRQFGRHYMSLRSHNKMADFYQQNTVTMCPNALPCRYQQCCVRTALPNVVQSAFRHEMTDRNKTLLGCQMYQVIMRRTNHSETPQAIRTFQYAIPAIKNSVSAALILVYQH